VVAVSNKHLVEISFKLDKLKNIKLNKNQLDAHVLKL
jgi:hypothetical protein